MIEDTRKNAYEMPDASIKHAVVLVNGGMDSRVCLQHAVKLYGAENVKALSVYYGQRSDYELTLAERNCAALGVERFEMNLSPILAFNKNYSSYIKGSDREIEDGTYAEILQKECKAIFDAFRTRNVSQGEEAAQIHAFRSMLRIRSAV